MTIQQKETLSDSLIHASGMMKSVIINAPRNIEIKEIAIPEPADNEVLIKMEGCGLCASSIPVWEGREWFQYPQSPGNPGHEGYGIVAKKGSKVNNIETGQRVAALSYNAFAEYDLAKATAVVPLPDELIHMPFPGEPLGCAMNIFERSEIKKGQTVAILGIGFLGALLIRLAKSAGARVIALSIREFSLQTAEEAGADEILQMNDHWELIEKVKEITNGNFCERVIECTGKQWPLDLAAELTAIRGKLIIAGYHQDGLRQVNMQLWNWRGIDVINAHERDQQIYIKGINKAIEATLKKIIDPKPLFTHSFSIEDLDIAFNLLTQRPEGFVKAIIKF